MACMLLGPKIAEYTFLLFDHTYLFLTNVFICAIGMVFLVADLNTADVPLALSFASSLVLPWGFLVFFMLDMKVLKLILSMFNTWYLLVQVTTMVICIGYVSERPGMVTMLCPSLISTIFVDAFPRQRRWRATAVGYLVMLTFVISFDLSLLLSLFPIQDPFSFEINGLEFSIKAFAFGCSLNLFIFSLRSVSILALYPTCLVTYTTPLRSVRHNGPAFIKQPIQKRVSGSIAPTRREDDVETEEAEHVWALCPQHKPIYIHSKETLIEKVLGKRGTSVLWGVAKSPFSFLLALLGSWCILPVFDIPGIPYEVSPGFLPSFVLIASSFGILNFYLVTRLLQTFQVYFLTLMSAIAFGLVYSTMLDWRLFTCPPILTGLLFSIMLDAYPNSGRFLAGARFYAVQQIMATGLIVMLLVSNDIKDDYFEAEVGEVTFNGSAIVISCCVNIMLFGCRNIYVLLTNKANLVVLQSLVEYRKVPKVCS